MAKVKSSIMRLKRAGLIELSLPCLLRAKLTFDTRPGRDLRVGELAWLHKIVGDEANPFMAFHMIALERAIAVKLMLPASARIVSSSSKSNGWFDVIA